MMPTGFWNKRCHKRSEEGGWKRSKSHSCIKMTEQMMLLHIRGDLGVTQVRHLASGMAWKGFHSFHLSWEETASESKDPCPGLGLKHKARKQTWSHRDKLSQDVRKPMLLPQELERGAVWHLSPPPSPMPDSYTHCKTRTKDQWVLPKSGPHNPLRAVNILESI